MLCILSCVCWQSVYLLWRNVYLGLLPFFGLGCFLFNSFFSLDLLSSRWIPAITVHRAQSFQLLYQHITISLSMFLSMDISVISSFRASQITLVRPSSDMFPCTMCVKLKGTYAQVGLLSRHRLHIA